MKRDTRRQCKNFFFPLFCGLGARQTISIKSGNRPAAVAAIIIITGFGARPTDARRCCKCVWKEPSFFFSGREMHSACDTSPPILPHTIICVYLGRRKKNTHHSSLKVPTTTKRLSRLFLFTLINSSSQKTAAFLVVLFFRDVCV